MVAVAEFFLATGCRDGLAGERHQMQVAIEIGEVGEVGEVGAACGCETHQAHMDGGLAVLQATN